MELVKFAFVLAFFVYTGGAIEEKGGAINPPDGKNIHEDVHVPIGPDSLNNTTTPKPITSTSIPTSSPSTTPSSTTLPTSTTRPTTTKTTPPTTTPTSAPTTSTPSTSTSKTTTTTSKPTSTTPAPSPNKPTVGTWNITKPGTNIVCILAKMEMMIEVDYKDANTTKKAVLNVPANATANGTCDNLKTNSISLMWSDSQNNFSHIVTFDFVNNTNTSEIGIDHIQVVLNGLHAPNETSPMIFFYNRTVFNAPFLHSYKCDKNQTLPLINGKIGSQCKASLTVGDLQIEAFRTTNTTEFGNAIDCINHTPDIVPIAVGCALAALVVVVLLAYLYGRRRSQARGYLSMFAETKQEEDYIPMKTLSCFR